MKSTVRLKPDIGDIVAYQSITHDTEIRGKVIDLLSRQFTIHIQSPKNLRHKTLFLFYNDDYVLI